MPRILFLRHTRTKANAAGLLAGGLTDSEPTPEGIELAHSKGAGLRKDRFQPNLAYCTSLGRTFQTAAILLKELGSDLEPTPLPAFDERRFGTYDGKPFSELMTAFDAFGPDPPGVEPHQTFINRVLDGLDRLKLQKADMTLVVTHTNVLAVLHCAIYEPKKLGEFWKTYETGYCEGFEYEY